VWALTIVGLVVGSLMMAVSQGGGGDALGFLGVLLFFAVLLGSAVMAVLGIGSAASALRPRGPHMLLATGGLLLNCLYLGGFVGLFTFGLYFATA
jgi:hypothetical protein